MKSTIAAFLMSIPLSAIGLMAVFGIPQMAPGSLFQKGPEDDVARGDYFEDEEPETPRKRKSRSAAPRSEEDGSAPAFGHDHDHDNERKPEARSERRSEWGDGDAIASTAGTNPFPRKSPGATPRSRPVSDSAFESIESGPRERVTQGHTDLTWKGARNRLTELGVTHFHLERGSTDDSFLFVCMFSPGDDPRVTRRFEAEAPEPLAAVDGVLGQIDTWMQRRFASQSQVGFTR